LPQNNSKLVSASFFPFGFCQKKASNSVRENFRRDRRSNKRVPIKKTASIDRRLLFVRMELSRALSFAKLPEPHRFEFTAAVWTGELVRRPDTFGIGFTHSAVRSKAATVLAAISLATVASFERLGASQADFRS
jgi:hypothetical protein